MGQKFFKRQKAEDTEGMAFPARLARLIIRRRGLIESVFAVGCLFSLLAMFFVNVNYDLTEYLPDDAESSIGIDGWSRNSAIPGRRGS